MDRILRVALGTVLIAFLLLGVLNVLPDVLNAEQKMVVSIVSMGLIAVSIFVILLNELRKML